MKTGREEVREFAATAVVRATPDGNTLLVLSSSTAIAASRYKEKSYRLPEDFSPISVLASTPLVVVVSAASPYKSVTDLVNAARQAPDSLRYGVGGTATSMHLAWLLPQKELKFRMTHIPYKGGAETMNALLGNEIHGQIATRLVKIFIRSGSF